MGKLDFTENDIALFTKLYDEAYQHAGNAHDKVEELRGDSLAQWIIIGALMSQCANPSLLISDIEQMAEVAMRKLPESRLKRFEHAIKASVKLVKFLKDRS